ncbi:hypothetical protein DL96DRAFT_1741650 [Flagelloscypha sp. PMI_526]|nr:hypothetical protein DL96DRAFT_1741650 [Flagelloscypha sp. PMI_526]
MSFKWPARFSKAAPSFVKAEPSSLEIFFEDLEALFQARDEEVTSSPTNGIALTDVEKIERSLRYLDSESWGYWRQLDEYEDRTNHTWAQFKKAVHREYPGTDPDDERQYTIGDMHSLIRKTSSNGIYSLSELSDFMHPYFTITKRLLEVHAITHIDIVKGFLSAFGDQEDITKRMKKYLQRNQKSRDPISKTLLVEAAVDALSGSDSIDEAFFDSEQPIRAIPTCPRAASRRPVESPLQSDDSNNEDPIFNQAKRPAVIKREPTQSALLLQSVEQTDQRQRESKELSQTYLEKPRKPISVPSAGLTAVNSNLAHPQESFSSSSGTPANFNPNCFYCGRNQCRMSICDVLSRDIERGYCRRDPGTHQIVPFTSESLYCYRGSTIKAKLEDYYYVNRNFIRYSQPLRSDADSGASMRWKSIDCNLPTYTIHRRENKGKALQTTNLRLGTMQNERESASEPQFSRVVQQKLPSDYGRKSTDDTTILSGEVIGAQQMRKEKSIAEKLIEEEEQRRRTMQNDGKVTGAYLPSVSSMHSQHNGNPHFKSQILLDDPLASQKTLDAILDTPLPVTPREILAVSPEVTKLMKEATTMHSEETKPALTMLQRTNLVTHGHMSVFAKDGSEYIEPANLGTDLPGNTQVVNDPYLAYYHAIGKLPEGTITAVISEPVRAIQTTIATRQNVEALIDPGCSIIAMSDRLCRELTLLYYPEITLPLHLADGKIAQTIGLAPNVPFTFGDITVYLQVHIVENAPFEVLLGRPFDRLTRIVARTYADGTQRLTVTDPNSGMKVTVPSYNPNNPIQPREPAQGSEIANLTAYTVSILTSSSLTDEYHRVGTFPEFKRTDPIERRSREAIRNVHTIANAPQTQPLQSEASRKRHETKKVEEDVHKRSEDEFETVKDAEEAECHEREQSPGSNQSREKVDETFSPLTPKERTGQMDITLLSMSVIVFMKFLLSSIDIWPYTLRQFTSIAFWIEFTTLCLQFLSHYAESFTFLSYLWPTYRSAEKNRTLYTYEPEAAESPSDGRETTMQMREKSVRDEDMMQEKTYRNELRTVQFSNKDFGEPEAQITVQEKEEVESQANEKIIVEGHSGRRTYGQTATFTV